MAVPSDRHDNCQGTIFVPRIVPESQVVADDQGDEIQLEPVLARGTNFEQAYVVNDVSAPMPTMQFSELPNQCPYSVTDELLRLLEDPPAVFNVVAHKLAVVGMSESRWGRFDIVEEDFKEKRVCMSGTNDVRIAHKMMSQSGAGCACYKGRKANRPNQDNYFFCRMENFTICGIADGHGAHGHWVSHWVVRCMLYQVMLALRNCNKLPSDAFIAHIFSVTHEMLKLRSEGGGLRVLMSGCTLSLCIIDHVRNCALLAWVGDSRCVVSTPDGDGVAFATTDHTPAEARERERILQSGGDVRRPYGRALRVYAQGRLDAPGLAMTRALGDTMAQSVGVVHQPDILRCAVHSGQFVLLCTDGIWDYMSPREAQELVSEVGSNGAREAAVALVKIAKERWLSVTPFSTDDMTALVVWV